MSRREQLLTVYAVVPHSIDGKPTGRGWVVRHSDAFSTRDYRGTRHYVHAWYARQRAAERVAHELTIGKRSSTSAPEFMRRQ